MTLNNIFSTIYGYMAIVILLFLASICVIYKVCALTGSSYIRFSSTLISMFVQRHEEQRFRKIDEKRGGRGFV